MALLLSINITDAPVDSARHVWVTFSAIELKPQGQAPITIDIPDRRIDLLALRDGLSEPLLPETTVPALCRSGRSLLPAARPLKRVWVGRATSTVAASIAALPPWPVAGHEAGRTVATTVRSLGAVTEMMALPA